MAARAQPGKQQVTASAEHGAQHQHPHHAQAHGQRTTHKSAHQRHDHAIDFGDSRHLVFGETHVHVKRIGHDAHHHVADAVDRDQHQDQHGLAAVAPQKIGKGLDQRTLQPFGGIARTLHLNGLRLGRKQHRHHAQQHRRGHHQVSGLPGAVLVAGRAQRGRDFGAGCNPQHAGAGPDHGDAVARLVRSGQRGLALRVGRLNTKSVQRNVLRGRAHSHCQRAPDHGQQRLLRVGQRHADQRRHDDALRQQQPAATPAQPAREQGNRQAVYQRRPDPLEAVGQTDPAQVTNRGAVDAGFTQPKTQRAKHQQQRQAGRKTQQQHAQRGGFKVHAQGLAPARGRGLCRGTAGGGDGLADRWDHKGNNTRWLISSLHEDASHDCP